jgi:integrase/recombinase XerD
VFSRQRRKRSLGAVGRPACKALDKYIQTARPSFLRTAGMATVFLSSRGLPISRKTVWHLIKTYARRRLDESRVKPHLLRHSFATHLLAEVQICAHSGNAGPCRHSYTQIYTKEDSPCFWNSTPYIIPRSRIAKNAESSKTLSATARGCLA